MHRILVVEDNESIAQSVGAALSAAQMKPVLVHNGEHADILLDQARTTGAPYDAVVLDLTLPGRDGMDVLMRMRQVSKDKTPVLVLTARSSVEERVRGLENGADDYLTKPFAMPELVARLKALFRRAQPAESETICHGNLCFDGGKELFMVNDAVLSLTPSKRSMLLALFRRFDEPVSKELLRAFTRDADSEHAVPTAVKELRRLLNVVAADVEISGVYGIGFRLHPKSEAKDGAAGLAASRQPDDRPQP